MVVRVVVWDLCLLWTSKVKGKETVWEDREVEDYYYVQVKTIIV